MATDDKATYTKKLFEARTTMRRAKTTLIEAYREMARVELEHGRTTEVSAIMDKIEAIQNL